MQYHMYLTIFEIFHLFLKTQFSLLCPNIAILLSKDLRRLKFTYPLIMIWNEVFWYSQMIWRTIINCYSVNRFLKRYYVKASLNAYQQNLTHTYFPDNFIFLYIFLYIFLFILLFIFLFFYISIQIFNVLHNQHHYQHLNGTLPPYL